MMAHHYSDIHKCFPSVKALDLPQFHIILEIELGLRISLPRLKLNRQFLFHSKDSIIVQVLAVLVKDLRRQLLVALASDEQVNMCWAVEVAIHHA